MKGLSIKNLKSKERGNFRGESSGGEGKKKAKKPSKKKKSALELERDRESKKRKIPPALEKEGPEIGSIIREHSHEKELKKKTCPRRGRGA